MTMAQPIMINNTQGLTRNDVRLLYTHKRQCTERNTSTKLGLEL